MAHLYINTAGKPHQKHSYSAGGDYDQSPLKYYLRRVLGWREKDTLARFLLGRALEQAIEYYHDNNGQGLISHFQDLWASAKDIKDLVYTKTEKNWETCNSMGTDWCKLYLIKQPSLPIPLGGGSVFQREYSKEVFPNDPNYGEIHDAGKLDIVTYVDPTHPLLARTQWKPEWGLLRPVVVDMKTSGMDFPENPGMAAFDKQLRRYSWQSGIRDVALLWFVKKSLNYKKGSRVTLLKASGNFAAGTEMLVADTTDDGAYLVASPMHMDAMHSAQGKKENGNLDTTKAATVRKSIWLENNAELVDKEDFTRQRLQFNAGYVTADSANDAGQIAARQIVEIVNSSKNNSWPNTFGIRFPHDDRNDPYFRAFVLKDEKFKADNFKLANQDELDELFDDDPEAEGENE